MSEIQQYDFCADGMYPSSSGGWVDAGEAFQRIKELESKLAEAKKGADRYEYIRKLNPHKFANLWRKNINGEGLFNDLVDAAIKENQQ